MKQLRFLLIFLLAGLSAFSQVQDVNGFGFSYNMLETKQVFNMPNRCDTALSAKYRATLKPGSAFWNNCTNTRWVFYNNVWHVDSTAGTGGVGVDSVYTRTDSLFYHNAIGEHFGGLVGAGGVGDTNNLSMRVDTLSAHVDAGLAALITSKVTNYSGVSLWGYGLWASRPMTSAGLYYSSGPDSIGLFYANAGVFTRLTNDLNKQYHLFVQKEGGRGKNIARAHDSTFVFKGLIDSGRLHWALVVNVPGDTALALVLDTNGLGGGGGAANLALGTRTATTMPITNSNGTGVTLPLADSNYAGLIDTGAYWKARRTLLYDSAPGIGWKAAYTKKGSGLVDTFRLLPINIRGATWTGDSSHLQWDIPAGGGARYYYDMVSDGGADPTGAVDMTAIFNTATATPNREIRFPPGTYKASGQLNINSSNITIRGSGYGNTHIVSGSTVTCSVFQGYNTSNTIIQGIDFQNTYAGATHSNVYKVQMDTLFDGVHFATLDSNIEISHCRFTGPKCDGVLFISHRNGFGGTIRHVNVHDNLFEYLGYAGGGMLGEYATETISDFHFDNNRIRHTGLADATLGFGFSGSALSHGNTINGNYATDYKMIGFEMTMWGYSRMQGNQGDSAYSGTTCLLSVNSTGAKAQFGNIVENNVSLDSTPNFPYFMSQKRLKMSNNYFKAFGVNTSILIDSVFESQFVNETYIKTVSAGQARTLYIRRGSSFLNFYSCNIIGYPAQFSLILAQDSSTHIKFNDCYTAGYSSNATLVNSDSTNIDLAGTFYNPVSKIINYAILPTNSSPSFNLTTDANGRIGKTTYSGTGGASVANNTGTIGVTRVQGSASTAIRSDGSQPIDTTDATGLKKYFLPLFLGANKLIDQHGFDITYAGGGRVIFDSTKYTQGYTNQIISSHATRVLNAGNSIGAGAQSSVIDSAYSNRFSRFVNLQLTNIAVPGIKSYDIIGLLLAAENIGHSNVTLMEGGLNNLRASASTNVLNSIPNAFGSGIVNHFLGYYVSGSDASITRTGTWTTNYPINGAGFGKTATAAYTNNHIGDAASWTTPSATTSIAFQLSGNVGAGAVVTAVLDGTTVQVVDTRNQVETGSYTPMAFCYTGLANTTHTLVLTVTGGNGLFILDYVGTLVANAVLPFVVIDVPYLDFTNGTAAGSDTKVRTDTVNNRLTALVALMVSKGLPVVHAQVNNYYHAVVGDDLYTDGVHPIDLGHFRFFQSIVAPLFTAVYSDGTIVHGNDGYFYGSKLGTLNRFAYQPEINVQTAFNNGPTMTGPTFWNGNGYSGSFNNFSPLMIDSLLQVKNTGNINSSIVNVRGQFAVYGSAAAIQVLSRNTDTTKGYQFVTGTGTLAIGDLYNGGRNIIQLDSGYRLRLMHDNASITVNSSPVLSTLYIDGNRSGAGPVQLKLDSSKATTTAQADAVEAVGSYWLLTNHTGVRDTIAMRAWVRSLVAGIGSASAPFSDATAIVKNGSDATKLFKVSASGITTATTRTMTAPDFDFTPAALAHSQTFSGASNIFNSGLFYVNGSDIQLNSGSAGFLWVSPVAATIGGGVNYSLLSFTASFTINTTNASYSSAFITCGTLSGAGTITLPSSGDGGRTYKMVNANNTGNTWTFAGAALKDGFGNTITAFPNGYTYEIYFNGATWELKSASYVGTGRTGIPIAGSYSNVGTATTTFTVTMGVTQPNNTYKVNVTPTDALGSALFYVTNKTTTTFDVSYLSGLTGTVTFDWVVTP